MDFSENKIICCFPGRFQPFHLGHLYVYDHLCKIFGKNNVWITTSNKQGPNSPLTFKQKQRIANQFLGIPKSRIIQCQIPYVPHELLDKLPDKNFSLILALSEKDDDRLANNDYFRKLPRNIKNLDKVEDRTYVYTTPTFADGRSATEIRKQFQGKMTPEKKKVLFVKLFGDFDQDIFNTLINK